MFQNCSSNFESPGASDLSRLAVDELPEGESEVDESAPPVVVIPPADNQNPEIKDEVLSSPPEVMINGDEVKILFRPKFPAQAFIIYGKDNTETNKETDYLNSHIQTITNIEVGVKYQYSIVLESENGTIYQTPQYSFELIANGEELGAPPAPLPEAESVKTPGTVTGMNPPQDSVQAGIWVDFSEIKSKGLSIGHYPDDDHYVAEFLYQNSRVTYWEVDSANKRIRSIAPPEPSNTAITLPKPNGNDDTEDVEKLINSNPGKEFVGQSGNYKIAE